VCVSKYSVNMTVASHTRRENGVNELFPGDKTGSFSVETPKEIHVFQFISSSPRHIALSPFVKVEVL